MTIALKPYASKLIKEVTVSLIKAPWFEVKNKPSVLWPGVRVKEKGTRSPAQWHSSREEIREESFLLRCWLNAAPGKANTGEAGHTSPRGPRLQQGSTRQGK